MIKWFKILFTLVEIKRYVYNSIPLLWDSVNDLDEKKSDTDEDIEKLNARIHNLENRLLLAEAGLLKYANERRVEELTPKPKREQRRKTMPAKTTKKKSVTKKKKPVAKKATRKVAKKKTVRKKK